MTAASTMVDMVTASTMVDMAAVPTMVDMAAASTMVDRVAGSTNLVVNEILQPGLPYSRRVRYGTSREERDAPGKGRTVSGYDSQ